MSRLEQETVIVFNAAEKEATVTTCDPMVRRRMARMFGKPALEWGKTMVWHVRKVCVLPRRDRAGKAAHKGGLAR